MSKVNILGVQVDAIPLTEVLQRVDQILAADRRAVITHVHVMGLNIAYEQRWFRNFLNSADLVYCDGMGVKLGARLLGHSIPQRFTLADWMYPLAERAAQQGYSFFFLGNPPGQAEKAAERLRQLYPGIRIVGTHHGYFDKNPASAENQALIQQINAARPDILFVGLGMPVQERWVMENWPQLQGNIVITCGAIFEYISGDLKRGPEWLTQHYLEWLVRLFVAPRRYTQRYLRDNPLFLARLIKQRLTGKTADTSWAR